MHDCAALEKLGLPCAALVSEAFLPQARWQADQLGLRGVEALLVGVRHPMSDKTKAEIEEKADAVFEETVAALTEPLRQREDDEQQEEVQVQVQEDDCKS